MAYIRAWMSSKVGEIRPQTTELAALETYNLGKRRHHIFSTIFHLILFILAGNDDIHKSLDKFEIWPDLTMYYRVSCPLASKNRCCHSFLVALYPINFKVECI